MNEYGDREALRGGQLDDHRQALLDAVDQMLAANDSAALGLILNSQHPADLAALFRHLDEEEGQRVMAAIAAPLAGEMLAEMDRPTMLEATEKLDAEEISELVEEMQPDDAADVLGDLDAAQSQDVLELMEEGAEEVRELMAHPEDTGGGIMTSRLVAVHERLTVAEAIDYLREWAREEETFYLYVVDEENRLVGTVPLRRLLLSSRDAVLAELTKRDPISVQAGMDQEEVARVFAEYDLLALPVVEESGELIGQVTIDDIVDVIQEEATEDIYEMAAIRPDALEERALFPLVYRRLPWLLVCLLVALCSAVVIDSFEATLTSSAALVLFIPAVMAMGGNSGIQTSTVTVRSLALGHLQGGMMRTSVLRELRISLAMGLVLGFLVYAVAGIWVGGSVGECVGLAMAVAVVVSAGLGATIPLIFRGLGIDPAVASGPLITALNDVLSLLIYFGISFYIIRLWG